MTPDVRYGTHPDDVCTLAEFCADNEEIADALRAALDRDGRYVGGGGAAPVFTVEVLPMGPTAAPEPEGTACSHVAHHWDDVCPYETRGPDPDYEEDY